VVSHETIHELHKKKDVLKQNGPSDLTSQPESSVHMSNKQRNSSPHIDMVTIYQ